MKKSGLIIFCLLLILCGCGKAPGNMQITDSEKPKSDDFIFEICDTNIKILEYTGTEDVVTIPETIEGKPVTVIGEDAFYQKTTMTEIHLPSGIEIIEKGAFYRCYSLTSVTIPATVTQIGSGAFFRCSFLQNIIVDAENSTYCDVDGVLFTKDKTQLHTYPEGKTETQYIIPSSVTKVEEDAFGYKTNLKVLGIPSSVTEFFDYNIFAYPDEITLLVASDSIAESYAIMQNIKYTIDETL